MPRFNEDKHREEVLGAFLETRLYPNVAREWGRVCSVRKQNAGHDVAVAFDWLSDPVVADEKAQNSDRWINDPAPTFVLELFGESWVTDGEPNGNIGWFVDPANETDHYVLVWLPDVSLFELADGVDDDPYLVYRPAAAVEFEPEAVAESVRSDTRYVADPSEAVYRFEFTPGVVRAFGAVAEPLPGILTGTNEADYGEWYYDPVHIHEAKVAIVAKEEIRETLAADGLTRDVLVDMGRKAITHGKVDVDSERAKYVVRTSGEQSGSADGECPVVLVVRYDTYHDVADETLHYRNGSWSEGTRLF